MAGRRRHRYRRSAAIGTQVGEVDYQFVRRLIPARRVLLEALPDDALQIGRHVIGEAGKGFWLRLRDPIDGVSARGAREWQPPRDHLVEQHPEREDVGPPIDGEPTDLLGAM